MAYLMHQKARRLAFYSHSTSARSTSPDDLQHEHATIQKSHIKRIDAGAPLKSLITALEEDGCLIVNDFTDASTLDTAKQELKPWLDGLFNGDTEKTVEDESNVRTIKHLLRHSTTVRETLFTTKLLQSLLDHFLTLKSKYYMSKDPVTSITSPQLSIAMSVSLKPGFQAQPLHRPDSTYHAKHTKSTSYSDGHDVSLSIVIPTSDITRSTGAPRVIPGSHLWGDGQPTFNEEHDVVSAEMDKGDVLITLGSLYQGVGGFRTGEKAERKTMFVISCVNGVTRPEDEDLLCIDDETIEGWNEVVRKRLGR